MNKRSLEVIALICLIGATAACYAPGLTGSFIADDNINIVQNQNLRIESLEMPDIRRAAASGTAGPLKRPLSMLSFAINYYFSGLSAYNYKLTNLAIHIVNGVLLFLFVKLLLSFDARIRKSNSQGISAISWYAMSISAIWLLHPFNLTSVLYVVQRMNSLATLFCLTGLVLYLHGRSALLDSRKSGFVFILLALIVATSLATLCKENGVLLPLLILTTEITVLKWSVPDLGSQRSLVALLLVTAILPALIATCYVAIYPEVITGGYSMRDFSMSERLMTEARVMWFYVRMIYIPSMTEMGLHHDDFSLSTGILSPWTTLTSIAALLTLVSIAVILRKKYPIVTFGVLFYLVGHVMESTVLPLELAYEHRNYLPMIGILVATVSCLGNSSGSLANGRIRTLVFLLPMLFFGGITALRAQQWGNVLDQRLMEVTHHPNSVRANTDLAGLYDHVPPTSTEDAKVLYSEATFYYRQAANISSKDISGLLGMLVVNAERGILPDPIVVETIENRLREVTFGPSNINALVGTARCIRSKACRLNQEVVDRLFMASMENPNMSGAQRNWVRGEFEGLTSHSVVAEGGLTSD
jgi:hypothetical protein